MILYKIVNISDPYTLEAPDREIAFAACLILGSGQYSLDPVDDAQKDQAIPFMMLGGESGTDKWCRANLGKSLDDTLRIALHDRQEELVTCLESCLIGSAADRKTYMDGLALIDDPAKKIEWRNRWHDQRRSSLNDIGTRAYQIAANIRAGTDNAVVEAPPQVFRS